MSSFPYVNHVSMVGYHGNFAFNFFHIFTFVTLFFLFLFSPFSFLLFSSFLHCIPSILSSICSSLLFWGEILTTREQPVKTLTLTLTSTLILTLNLTPHSSERSHVLLNSALFFLPVNPFFSFVPPLLSSFLPSFLSFLTIRFLVASTQLYKRLCLSVRPSVGPSVMRFFPMSENELEGKQ